MADGIRSLAFCELSSVSVVCEEDRVPYALLSSRWAQCSLHQKSLEEWKKAILLCILHYIMLSYYVTTGASCIVVLCTSAPLASTLTTRYFSPPSQCQADPTVAKPLLVISRDVDKTGPSRYMLSLRQKAVKKQQSTQLLHVAST